MYIISSKGVPKGGIRDIYISRFQRVYYIDYGHMSDGYCEDIENDEKNDEKMTNSCDEKMTNSCDEKMTNSCGKMAGNRSSMEPTCVYATSLHVP